MKKWNALTEDVDVCFSLVLNEILEKNLSNLSDSQSFDYIEERSQDNMIRLFLLEQRKVKYNKKKKTIKQVVLAFTDISHLTGGNETGIFCELNFRFFKKGVKIDFCRASEQAVFEKKVFGFTTGMKRVNFVKLRLYPTGIYPFERVFVRVQKSNSVSFFMFDAEWKDGQMKIKFNFQMTNITIPKQLTKI